MNPKCYYNSTCASILFEMHKRNISAKKHENASQTLEHVHWMVLEIVLMDQNLLDEALKANRWIGWVLAVVEQAGFWDNKVSRRLISWDRENQLDRPTSARSNALV